MQIEIFHPDRIVVGVGRGEVSLQEYQKFLADITEAGVLHYRKIVDISLARSSTLNRDHLLALEARLVALAPRFPRGPLAIVVDPPRMQNALIFKALAGKDRPVEAFKSIHDARKWLKEQPIVEP